MRKYLLPILLIGFWGCDDPKEEETTPTEVTLWGIVYSVEETNSLDLSYNELTGEIPSEICNQGDSTPIVGNNKLCPPYPNCISQEDIDSQDTSNCP